MKIKHEHKANKEYKATVEMTEVGELFSKSVLLETGESLNVVEVFNDMVEVTAHISMPDEGGSKRVGFGLSLSNIKQLHDILGEYLESKELTDE